MRSCILKSLVMTLGFFFVCIADVFPVTFPIPPQGPFVPTTTVAQSYTVFEDDFSQQNTNNYWSALKSSESIAFLSDPQYGTILSQKSNFIWGGLRFRPSNPIPAGEHLCMEVIARNETASSWGVIVKANNQQFGVTYIPPSETFERYFFHVSRWESTKTVKELWQRVTVQDLSIEEIDFVQRTRIDLDGNPDHTFQLASIRLFVCSDAELSARKQAYNERYKNSANLIKRIDGVSQPLTGKIYAAPPYVKIFEDHDLSSVNQTTNIISLSQAINESESVQVVVDNSDGALNNMTLSVNTTDLVNGNEVISKSTIEHFIQEYVYIKHDNNGFPVDMYFPDPLSQDTERLIDKNLALSFWLRFHTPPGTKPGLYTGNIIIKNNGQAIATIPLQVRVQAFSLGYNFKSNYGAWWIWGNSTPTNDSRKTAAIQLDLAEVTSKLRMPPTNILLNLTKEAKAILLGAGMNSVKINLPGGHGTTSTPYDGTTDMYATAYVTEYQRLLRERLDDLELLGVKDMAWIYLWDETHGKVETYDKIIRLRQIIDGVEPGLITEVEATGVPELRPYVNIFSTTKTPRQLWTDVLNAGNQLWGWPYNEYAIGVPLTNAIVRAVGLGNFKYGITGTMYWGVTAWWGSKTVPTGSEKIWEYIGSRIRWDGVYRPFNGDGIMFYPGNTPQSQSLGLVHSTRTENVRDAIEDWEYAFLLKQMTEQSQDQSFLNAANNLFDRINALKFESVTDPFADPNVIVEIRNDIGTLINSQYLTQASPTDEILGDISETYPGMEEGTPPPTGTEVSTPDYPEDEVFPGEPEYGGAPAEGTRRAAGCGWHRE